MSMICESSFDSDDLTLSPLAISREKAAPRAAFFIAALSFLVAAADETQKIGH